MNISGWFQLALYLVLLILITKPLGLFLFQVLDANGKTFLDPVVKPFERLTFRIFGVNPEKEQGWILYTISMLIFELVTVLFTYLILRFQNFLPLNPQGQAGVADHLAFNTAWSFATNTNWQSYGGESTMSYLSQMLALASHNFFSAAIGIAIAAAVVRGIARHSTKTIGNFWVDLVRINYYLPAPDQHHLRGFSGCPGHPAELQAVRHGKSARGANRPGTEERRRRQPGERCEREPGDGRSEGG